MTPFLPIIASLLGAASADTHGLAMETNDTERERARILSLLEELMEIAESWRKIDDDVPYAPAEKHKEAAEDTFLALDQALETLSPLDPWNRVRDAIVRARGFAQMQHCVSTSERIHIAMTEARTADTGYDGWVAARDGERMSEDLVLEIVKTEAEDQAMTMEGRVHSDEIRMTAELSFEEFVWSTAVLDAIMSWIRQSEAHWPIGSKNWHDRSGEVIENGNAAYNVYLQLDGLEALDEWKEPKGDLFTDKQLQKLKEHLQGSIYESFQRFRKVIRRAASRVVYEDDDE
jgi:hypothetical protein